MNYELRKPQVVKLRDIGKDERWLQEQIGGDPSILGLGDLNVIERERVQASGGHLITISSYLPTAHLGYSGVNGKPKIGFEQH
jgi:hypothetical protein